MKKNTQHYPEKLREFIDRIPSNLEEERLYNEKKLAKEAAELSSRIEISVKKLLWRSKDPFVPSQ